MNLLRIRAVSVLAVCALVASALGSIAFSERVAQAAPSTWSIVHSPNPSRTKSLFADVSCTSSTFCVAVGWVMEGTGYSTLTETWNGTSWSVVPSQSPGIYSQLNGVSCTSPTNCIAVGNSDSAGNPVSTLVESWNGTSWSIVPSPDPAGANDLSGVSCTSPSFCVAVGTNNGFGGTLVETWDGTNWSVTPSPNVANSSGNQFDQVSCTSPTSCVAVGLYIVGFILEQTLVETWDGTSWTVTPSPNVGANNSWLSGVSCTSVTFCIAVGYPGVSSIPLIEFWDGTSWTVTPIPKRPKHRDGLSSVTCTSATNCVSVGSWYSRGRPERTLIETWNGTSWSVSPSPSRTRDSVLDGGISCADSMNCMAVGYSSDSAGAIRTLALNGSTL
jgi:hypothetical protein